MAPAPEALCDFARHFGATHVMFVDDAVRCQNSIRADSDIFVNTRCTTWARMTSAPLWCQSAQEAILLRLLHEIGHIHCGHTGARDIRSTAAGLNIDRSDDPFTQNFGGAEGEAWEFALSVRRDEPAAFAGLLEVIRQWYAGHSFSQQDWAEDQQQQLLRTNGTPLGLTPLPVPDWLMARYASYRPQA